MVIFEFVSGERCKSFCSVFLPARIRWRLMRRLCALACVLSVGCHAMAAGDPPKLNEILASLDAGRSWVNYPLTLEFRWRVDRFKPRRQTLVYESHGLLFNGGHKGLQLLDEEHSSGVVPGTARQIAYVEDGDYLMDYSAYPPIRVATDGTPVPPSPAQTDWTRFAQGDATIGLLSCRCNSRFIPFPLTPGAVTAQLKRMSAVECVATNSTSGRQTWLVSGQPENESEGSRWNISFERLGELWLPVSTEVWFGRELQSVVTASFDGDEARQGHYTIKMIETVVLRDGERIATVTTSNVRKTPGDKMGKLAAIAASIPPGIIVNDYRFGKPLVYQMGYRPPSEAELARMTSSAAAVTAYQSASLDELAPIPERSLGPVLRVVLGVLIVAPLVIWFFWSRRKLASRCE